MKNLNFSKIKSLPLIAVGILCSSSAFGQITNDQINVGTQPYQIKYDGFNDLASDGEAVYQIEIEYQNADFWSPVHCFGFNTPSVPHLEFNTDDFGIEGRYLMDFDETIDLKFTAWEDDNGEACNYNADGDNPDDDFYEGLAEFTVCCSTSFTNGGEKLQSRWYTNHNDSEDGWLFPGTPEWDFKLATAWRYSHGASCADPLIFMNLDAGLTRTNFNSNSREIRETHGWVDDFLEYINVEQNESSDIYYSFTIVEELDVTISTEHARTNFDTYLRLYTDNCETFIAEDDDSGAEGTSIISETLTAGTYIIHVEGYNSNEGDFLLSIDAGGSHAGISNEDDLISTINVFPNPAEGMVKIELGKDFMGEATIKLIDMIGRTVYETESENGENVQINLEQFTPGAYIVLVSDEVKTTTERLIIQ